jgi:hypothetical protein
MSDRTSSSTNDNVETNDNVSSNDNVAHVPCCRMSPIYEWVAEEERRIYTSNLTKHCFAIAAVSEKGGTLMHYISKPPANHSTASKLDPSTAVCDFFMEGIRKWWPKQGNEIIGPNAHLFAAVPAPNPPYAENCAVNGFIHVLQRETGLRVKDFPYEPEDFPKGATMEVHRAGITGQIPSVYVNGKLINGHTGDSA